MVFKRRESRHWSRIAVEFLWPRGGWRRAALYIRHRILRVSAPPEVIARGIFAGAFIVFTPFYGLHFVFSALLAKLMRGNILAALLSTFIGNPLTYVPIAIVSLQTGYFMLGRRPRDDVDGSVWGAFGEAWRDLWDNFKAVFTPEQADWTGLAQFYDQVFLPWMIGGIVPGIISGLVFYYVSLPVITAYQRRRRQKLKRTMERLRTQRAASGGKAGDA